MQRHSESLVDCCLWRGQAIHLENHSTVTAQALSRLPSSLPAINRTTGEDVWQEMTVNWPTSVCCLIPGTVWLVWVTINYATSQAPPLTRLISICRSQCSVMQDQCRITTSWLAHWLTCQWPSFNSQYMAHLPRSCQIAWPPPTLNKQVGQFR